MSMLKDVSWGAIIAGAVVVTAIAALAPVTGATSVIAALAAETGLGTGAATAGVAAVGGVVGHYVSKLFHRAQDATTTLIGR